MSKLAFIIETIIFAVYIPTHIYLMCVYFSMRKKFLLKHRIPYLTLTTNLLLLFASLIIFYEEVAFYYNLYFSCVFTLIVLHIFLFSVGEFLLLRSLYLYSIYFFQNLDYDEILNTDNLTTSRKLKVSFLRPRFLLSLVLLIIFLHINIIVLQVMFNLGDDYSFKSSNNCIVGIERTFTLIYFLVIMLLIFLVLIKLFKVKEKLSMVKELLISQINILLILIIYFPLALYLVVILKRYPDKIHNFFFFGINFFILPIIVFTHMLGTLALPIYLQRKIESKNWSSIKVCDEETMDTFLQNEKNFKLLYDIAKLYFCVELLEFWRCVRDYKNTIIIEEANDKKKLIFSTFLTEESKMELNVSSNIKEDVKKRMMFIDVKRIIFDDVFREVLRLIMDNVYNAYIFEKEKIEFSHSVDE